jgi:hypothetical protein
MIEIRSGRLQPQAGTGPRTMTHAYYFDRVIRNCWVALMGYKLGYAGEDHHVRTITVDLSAAARDTEFGRGVVVDGTLLLNEDGGDEVFVGWVDYLLFVDLGQLIPGGEGPSLEPVVVG